MDNGTDTISAAVPHYASGKGLLVSNYTWAERDAAGNDAVVNTNVFDTFTCVPAPVPEASTTASFGLLLALGLGGVVIAKKRKTA